MKIVAVPWKCTQRRRPAWPSVAVLSNLLPVKADPEQTRPRTVVRARLLFTSGPVLAMCFRRSYIIPQNTSEIVQACLARSDLFVCQGAALWSR